MQDVDAPIKRLLITRHDKIGDFVLTLPLCKAIKDRFPQIHLAVLVSKVNYEFAKRISFIDEVILYGSDFKQTLTDISLGQFDQSISCYIDTRLGMLLWAARIPERFAPATKFAQIFFNRRITQRRSLVEKTEWQYNLDLGKIALGAPELSFHPPLLTPKGHNPKKRVVFHPGFGGSSDGNLTIKDYVSLARVASRIAGVEVVFTFGPDDQLGFVQIKGLIDFEAKLIQSDMSLMEFCCFLSESALLVSTSTGPMHLAGAVNIPTVSFFGGSLFASYKRWAPISETGLQKHFTVTAGYGPELLHDVETAIKEILGSGEVSYAVRP